MSPVARYPEIAPQSSLGRSGAQRGPIRPRKRRDDLQRALGGDRAAAGRFSPIAALLVGHDVTTSLPPRALHWAKIGSVSGRLATGDMV